MFCRDTRPRSSGLLPYEATALVQVLWGMVFFASSLSRGVLIPDSYTKSLSLNNISLTETNKSTRKPK
jgi:hypothetical protein